MNPNFGDFIQDNFFVVPKIQELGAHYGSESPTSLYNGLLVFAESLLTKPPEFRPLIGTILGFVANERHSPANKEKIFHVFNQLDSALEASLDSALQASNEYPTNTSTQTAIETYLCTARMVAPDSDLGRQLRMETCDLFATIDIGLSFVETFLACAENPHNTETINAILHEVFDQATKDFAEQLNIPEMTARQKRFNLRAFGNVCARIAVGLPNGSALEEHVINQCLKTLDDLHVKGRNWAWKLIDECEDLCASYKPPNAKFLSRFKEKCTDLKLREELYPPRLHHQPGVWERARSRALLARYVPVYH